MQMRLYGECVCPLLFKLQCILGKIVQRIYIPSTISPSEHWNSYSTKLRSWSGTRKKSLVSIDQLAAAHVAKDNLAYWQGSSVCDCENLRLLWCMGGLSSDPVKAWKEKINWFMDSRQHRDLDRIDGQPMEFEWKSFPGFTTLQVLAEIQKMMTEMKCEPEQFQGRILLCQCITTLYGEKRKPRNLCCQFFYGFRLCSKIRATTLVVCWAWIRKEVVQNSRKPNGEWDDVADIMMMNFNESGHPVFRGSSAFERGDLKSKGKGELSIHFNGSDEAVEVILRTVISVNQLSVYGAVAELCEELAWEIATCSTGTEQPVAPDKPGNHGNATRSVDNRSNFSERYMRTGKPVAWIRAEVRRSSRTPSFDQTLLQCRPREGCWKRTVFHDTWRHRTWQTERILSRVHLASKWSIISSERMDPLKHEDRSSSGCNGQLSSRTLRSWNHDRILFWRQHLLLDQDRDWNQQIRNGDVGRDSRWKYWREG